VKYWRLFLTGMALSPALSGAAEMRSVQVEFEDDHYVMDAEVWFDADQETVFGVFLDWDLAAEFSSVIVEAKNVGPDKKGGMGYYIHNRGCILFFCKSTRRNGSVTSEAYTVIRAIADPETSDFDVSEETWTFSTVDDGTMVRYELRMKPSFWVPPLIGPYLIKKKLRDDGAEAFDRIEKIAQERQDSSG
jgi:hypothetical protein